MRKLYFLIILPVIFVYILFRTLQDKKATFGKYLNRELQTKRLEFVSSQPLENTDVPEIEKIPSISAWNERRTGIGTMIGGRATWIDNTYKVIRKVKYKDYNGSMKEAFAAIEFSGFFIRRLLGISWYPKPK